MLAAKVMSCTQEGGLLGVIDTANWSSVMLMIKYFKLETVQSKCLSEEVE